MKKISVVIPCFDEVENVVPLSEAILHELLTGLARYDYELLFIDNFSTDGTREKLELLCQQNKKIKAIFNARNFGGRSGFYALCQADGDCVIFMAADFQDPPDLIPALIGAWEDGYKVVSAIKNNSEENQLMYFLRSCYYRLIKKMSPVGQIEHFTGFGLYDRSFVEVLKKLDDPEPYMRGIVAELGPQRKNVYFTQPQRRAGKSHTSWYDMYDVAMLGFTTYTKVGLRLATITGFVFAALCMVIALCYLVAKLIWWDYFPLGTAPMLIGIFFLGSIQIFFIGLVGEYVMNINTRLIHRPLVVEERRLNFTDGKQQNRKTGGDG